MTEATRWWIRFRASPVGKIFSSLHVATKRKRLLPLFFFATEDNTSRPMMMWKTTKEA
jgi:hypothetical protein